MFNSPALNQLSQHRARRGQIGIMSIFFLIMMIYMVGMFVNVAQAVTRKIEAQMICDAAALTGAAYQAKGLNAITQLNRGMGGVYGFYWAAGTVMGTGIWLPHQAIYQAIKGVFEAALTAIRLYLELLNVSYAGLAYVRAKENANHNIKYFWNISNPSAKGIKSYGGGYWVKETIGILGPTSTDPLLLISPTGLGIPAPMLTADSMLMPYGATIKGDFTIRYLQWETVGVCPICVYIPVPPYPRTYDYRGNLWINNHGNKNGGKGDEEELRFYWAIQIPETPGMFMGNKFRIPSVTAVGSAKAFNGDRGPDKASDMHDISKAIGAITAFIPTNNASGQGFKPTYRARLCPTPTDFILHFYAFGPQYYKDYSAMPSLWGGVLH